MADNTTLDAGVGGDSIRDKDRAGVKTQIVGLDIGIGGSETLMTAAALADATSNPTTAPWAGMLMCFNGTTWDRVRGDTTNGIFANVKTSALPTGAATAAKQPALGTAGVASADVITVQGIASGTVLPVSDGGGSLTVDGTVTATGPLTDTQLRASAVPVSGTVTSTLSATTNAGATAKTSDYDTGAGTDTVTSFGIALPASGGAVQGGTSTNPVRTDPTGTTTQPVSGTVTATGPLTDTQLRASAVPVSLASAPSTAVTNAGTFAVQIAANSSVNVAQVAGTTTDTNSGNKSAGTQRIVLATDQPQLTNAFKVDPSAVTSPVSLASLPALATGSNLIGRVNLEPETTGGLSIFHLVSAATTNATNVKASAGQVYGWYVYNSNAAARKLVFHNTAGTPTAGASVSFAIVIPPTSSANVEFTAGIAFATGIGITTVTDLTDAGATAVAASDLIINIFYK